jgi:hypothetical protein
MKWQVIYWNNRKKGGDGFFLALLDYVVMLTDVNLTGLQLDRFIAMDEFFLRHLN